MNNINEKFKNIESLIKEAYIKLSENSIESLIRVLEIQNEIGISYFNNEVQLQIVKLINSEILYDSQLIVTLEEELNIFQLGVGLKNKSLIVSKINLMSKSFDSLINIDLEINKLFMLVNKFYKDYKYLNQQIKIIEEEISKDKRKKIFKSKTKLNELKQQIDSLNERKTNIKMLEHKVNDSCQLNLELKSILLSEMEPLISKFRDLGFEINDSNYIKEKVNKFTIYKKLNYREVKDKGKYIYSVHRVYKEDIYSNAYFEDQNIVIFNNRDFKTDNMLEGYIFNKGRMEDIYNLILKYGLYKDISIRYELKDEIEYIFINFITKDTQYTFNNFGELSIKGKEIEFYYVLNLIQKIIDKEYL